MATNISVILDGGDYFGCSEDDFMQNIRDQFARGATHLVVIISLTGETRESTTSALCDEFDARFVWTKSPTCASFNVYPKTPA